MHHFIIHFFSSRFPRTFQPVLSEKWVSIAPEQPTKTERKKKPPKQRQQQKNLYGEKRSPDYDDVHEIENFLNYETN